MKKGTAITFAVGVLTGLALCGPAAQAADYLTARPTTQTFYLDGQKIDLTAYLIGGSNYIRLRDIGRAVNFGVNYDAATNSVYIAPNSPYIEEVTTPAQSQTSPSTLAEENVRAAILALKETYPHGAVYPAPYRSASGGPYGASNSNCAGWAVLCSDAAFGSLPWRRVDNPRWEEIRAGDLVEYKNSSSHHVVVVLERTADYIKVTESGTNNKALWGGQYPRWWLEGQPQYLLYTRYPE